jgi:hypothetical protein
MAGYRGIPQTSFGAGLNLLAGPDVVAPDQSIDALNVLYLPAGGVRQRDGWAKFTAVAGTNPYDSLTAFYTAAGIKQLVAGAGLRLEQLSTAGAVIANSTAPTASPHYFARFAAPGSEHLYIANGTDTVRRWDGTAFSTPTYTGTTPTGRLLAVESVDNRLINARTSANPSRVLFSDPGVPTTFSVNNYVELSPGDGEAVNGLAAWREYVFAFKDTKVFVFYSTGTDATGQPVFNYRPLHGAGCVGGRAVCTSPEGVYFLDRRGVYVTSGQEPQLISEAISPLFFGYPSLFYGGATINQAAISNSAIWWHQNRLYAAVPTGASSTPDRLLVYSPADHWWTVYDIPGVAMTSFRPSSTEELVFASGSQIGRYYENSGYAADNTAPDATGGTAILSAWRSGWADYGSPDDKTIRETKLWGEGTAQFALAANYLVTPPVFDTVAFGTSGDMWSDGTNTTDVWGSAVSSDLWGPAQTTTARKIRQGRRGTVFSLSVRNTTLRSTWALHRLEHGLRGGRTAGVVATERTVA